MMLCRIYYIIFDFEEFADSASHFIDRYVWIWIWLWLITKMILISFTDPLFLGYEEDFAPICVDWFWLWAITKMIAVQLACVRFWLWVIMKRILSQYVRIWFWLWFVIILSLISRRLNFFSIMKIILFPGGSIYMWFIRFYDSRPYGQISWLMLYVCPLGERKPR